MLNARTLGPEHILNPLQWRVSGNWPNRASVLLSFHFVSWNDWLCRYFNIDCSPSLTNFYELCAGKKEKFLLVTGFHQQETIFVTNCGWKHTIVKDPNMKNQWLIWPNIYLIADWYLYLLCWEPWLKQAPAATDHCTCQVVTATGPGSPVLGSCLWWELLASSLHDVDVQIQQEASTREHSPAFQWQCPWRGPSLYRTIRPMMSWKPHQSHHRLQIVVSQQRPSPQHSTVVPQID